jgi:hypothetical protein
MGGCLPWRVLRREVIVVARVVLPRFEVTIYCI